MGADVSTEQRQREGGSQGKVSREEKGIKRKSEVSRGEEEQKEER